MSDQIQSSLNSGQKFSETTQLREMDPATDPIAATLIRGVFIVLLDLQWGRQLIVG